MSSTNRSCFLWQVLGHIAFAIAFISGAVLVVLSVVPLSQGLSGVRSSLAVMHPLFSYILWPVVLLAEVWSRRLLAQSERLALFGAALFAVGAFVLFLLVLTQEPPALLNAIPLIDHPLFGAALGLATSGLGIAFISGLGSVRQQNMGGRWPLIVFPAISVGAVLGAAWMAWMSGGESGGGHLGEGYLVAQAAWPAIFLPVLIALWLDQSEQQGDAQVPLRWCGLAMFTSFVPGGGVAWCLLSGLPTGIEGYQRIDLVVSWTVWPALAASAVVVFFLSGKSSSIARRPLAASFALALVGASCGLLADETGALFRAQSHWFGGALLLACLPLRAGALWPRAGRILAGDHRLVWVPFAVAMLLLGLGLGADGWAQMLARIGGGDDAQLVLQQSASAMVWIGLLALLFAAIQTLRRDGLGLRIQGVWGGWFRQLDPRWRVVGATVCAVALIGAAIALLPAAPDAWKTETGPSFTSGEHGSSHAVEQINAEVGQRFAQGVAMLRAHRYDDAATAFHRVLALSPEMPEAHVNMGFAMLGKKDYQLALEFFEGATELRGDQLNAYYGMALALEGLGRFDAAAGAMRTYQHLTSPDDPFLPKVNEKLKEYEARHGVVGAAPG